MKSTIEELIKKTESARKNLHATEGLLRISLTAVMQKLVKNGSVIDMRVQDGVIQPMWLLDVKTMQGNDRGTKLFEVASIVNVVLNENNLAHSEWWCDAYPINERTGKRMQARAATKPVRLRGYIVPPAIQLIGDGTMDATNVLMDIVTTYEVMMRQETAVA